MKWDHMTEYFKKPDVFISLEEENLKASEPINNFHVACYITHIDSVIESGYKSYTSYEECCIIFIINLPKQFTYLI